MSEKSSRSSKPLDLPGLLLDENVGSPTALRVLRDFDDQWQIERHGDYFTRGSTPDPEVITFCAERGWGIISADDAMWFMHQELLRIHGIRLFTFTNGNYRGAEYIASLVFARSKIIEFMKTPGPFCGRIHKNGFVTISRGVGAVPHDVSTKEAAEHAKTFNRPE